MLIIGISLGLVAGAAATMVLKHQLPNLSAADYKFYSFVISSVFFQGMTLVLVNTFLRQHGVGWREFLGLPDPDMRRAIGLGLVTALVVIPLALGLNELCKRGLEWLQQEVAPQPTLQVLQMAGSIPRRICFGFSAIVLAPIVEEILFRGIAYKALRDRGWPRFALVMSSVLFGLIHVNLMTFLPLTAFAVVLALLYERTGTLLAPMAAHAFFNAVNFTLFLMTAK